VFPGNLHLNVIANAYTPEIEAALEPFIYELVGKHICQLHSHVDTDGRFSQLQGLHLCRARRGAAQGTRPALLEERDES
jgi:hypothetical protein